MIYTRLTMNDASSLLAEFRRWIKALHSLFISGLPKVEEMESRNSGFLLIFKDSKEGFPHISCLQQFLFIFSSHHLLFPQQ